jgi:uncharacterized protein (TIGR00661 family)
MARIVYGVSGEGSGHSSRAREMATHLRETGHEVRLVSYDRGYRNLRDDFDVFETEGLHIASENNRVSIVKTFTDNLKRLPQGQRKLRELNRELFHGFQPACVITDFEPMTAYLASHHDLPLITLDNQHRMRYLDYECPPGLEQDSVLTKTIIRAMVPWPDVSLVTAFCCGPLTNQRTFLFPPILRREVLSCTPSHGEHVLVYATSGFDSLLQVLSQFASERFRVYGYDRSDREGVLQFRPFSKDGFLTDLASAKAVVATAGFTLISEALYLRKPYLALPMQGQFEQQLNGYQLSQLGYGACTDTATVAVVTDFLQRLPDYERRLAEYRAGDNSEIKRKLDQLLADDVALARQFHRARA